MPSLTIKELPPDLLRRLREQATANRRSINQEVLTLLERHVRRPATEAQVAELRAFQQEMRAAMKRPLTAAEVRAAIREGRE